MPELQRQHRGVNGKVESPLEEGLIGQSPAMLELKHRVAQVAPTKAAVLITGESGTGKERVAQALHSQNSIRRHRKFIAINCAAMPENLIESELFGYEKGAFSGATQSKEGLFEVADGGTLLLDEIGDMPLVLQSKLLRVLQESEVRRLGATRSRKVDVRILSATHRDLLESVKQGSFREDLLYRLQVVEIRIPSLRERLSDLELLASYFLRQANARYQKSITTWAPGVMHCFSAYGWPGNIRELSNVIERSVILSSGAELTEKELPEGIQAAVRRQSIPQDEGSGRLKWSQGLGDSVSGVAPVTWVQVPLGVPFREVEDFLIQKTLEVTCGDKQQAAKLLGIHSRTIYRRLDQMDAKRKG
jgi:transcriptional regulator with PAS, ATPase and Fis domain